ncbi:MAG TPA: phage protein Gp36 family protein [Candidatus Saccharimonadales bacterium]|nr:phage protein Gp36 family protein [Candidatus Saccharimonadales bacterium]
MDTWITITPDDILASINNAELTAALNTAIASGQGNPLDTLIPDVTAEVRGYVRRRNTLGQSGTLPQELKNAAVDIIIYRTASRLRKRAIAEDKKADHDQALNKLAGVADGTVAVSAPDNPTTEVTSAPAPQFDSQRRAFGWERERGI